MKLICSRCNNNRVVIVRHPDSTSRIGFSQFAIPCPLCRSTINPPTVQDGKTAAAGGNL